MAWGIGGVLLLLIFAIFRLAPIALELENSSMSMVHWLTLAFSVIYMAYAEGYKGFHLGFAPRVVVRARYLANNPRPLHVLLAPLFCMGYIYATRRRQIVSFAALARDFGCGSSCRFEPWRAVHWLFPYHIQQRSNSTHYLCGSAR